MKIEMRRLDAITPYAANAKKHSPTQVANLVESIRQFGWTQPLVVDAAGVLVIGHCRFLAAQRMGLEEAPCVCVDDLTPEQVNALRLVDNKTNESPWDLDLLAEELPGLDLSGFDFEWGLPDQLQAGVVEDDYDPDPPHDPKVKPGQVYQLGRHRLMCGDSTSLVDVQMLTGGAQVDLLLTDPPYNVDYSGAAGKMANDAMSSAAFRQFLAGALKNAAAVMKPGAPFYLWHTDAAGFDFRGACLDAGLRISQCLIWVKPQIVLGYLDFQMKHEPCLYGWKGGQKHYFFKNRRQASVLNFDKPSKSAEHPTMKPIELFDYQMQCSSRPDEVVLDLFAGSGTAIMAAEQNGRTAYCMELDPRYVDVIIARWERFTGGNAILLND